MMTRTECEYRRVWTQALQLPSELSERHIVDFVDACARGNLNEGLHHLEQAFNIHFPLRLRDETNGVQPAKFDAIGDFEKQVQTIVDASAYTRVANRGQIAALKFRQLWMGVVDLMSEPWGKQRDDEYYVKCTWLMHVARVFGQYLDVHL